MTVNNLIYHYIKSEVKKLKDKTTIDSITFDEKNFRLGITIVGYPSDLELTITLCVYVGDATIDIFFHKEDPYGKTQANHTFKLKDHDLTFIPKLIEPWYRKG